MSKNNFASDISQDTLDQLEIMRSNTMATKAFNDWCKELRVSASYVDKNIHGDKASDMMDMMDREQWIRTYKRYRGIREY